MKESELRTLEPVQGAIEDVDLTGLEDIPECDEEAIDEDEPSDSSKFVKEISKIFLFHLNLKYFEDFSLNLL